MVKTNRVKERHRTATDARAYAYRQRDFARRRVAKSLRPNAAAGEAE
jgi:hypothetical protein